MQQKMSAENLLYEYAVVRFVPAVERSEFINVGLIMMCKRHRWIRFKTLISESKFACFKSELSLDCLQRQLHQFEMVANGDANAGPIAGFTVEERFRWLTAEKSACLQTSRPHPGITDNLESTFNRLFSEQVM